MPKKKICRADNTYLIEGGSGDNPKLMGRALSDGRDSLYLEFYLGKMEAVSRNGRTYQKSVRRNEILNLYLWQAPRTAEERRQNHAVLETAKRVRFERGQQLLERGEGYRLNMREEVDFLQWMWGYYEAYTKADKRQIKRACESFADFLINPEELFRDVLTGSVRQYRERAQRREERARFLRLKPRQLTPELVADFADYLQRRYRGEGPHTVLARFKKMVKAAVAADVLRKDPCAGVSITVDEGSLKKDVLSQEEVTQLMACHYEGENPEIRRAFIFCLYTGLRWCDVRMLRYANIDFSNRLLRFEQAKTRGHSAASSVAIPLNDGLLGLIGRGEREALIFTLPSYTMCRKALRHWTAHAGIDKHITWHCARHSFAVNILNNGANIKTVASLLGHSGLKHTEKYTRAVDSLKEAAINSLPELKL